MLCEVHYLSSGPGESGRCQQHPGGHSLGQSEGAGKSADAALHQRHTDRQERLAGQ